MTALRPLDRGDIPAVGRLFALVWRADERASDNELERFFASTLLNSPWADPELPSLVATDGDEIVGFIGSNVRRMVFDGEPLRMVCSAHLVAHPRVRGQAVGARLMKALLSGPQDLTITDGATDEVRRMWEAFKGAMVPLGALSFARIFRPFGLATELTGTRRRLGSVEQPARAVSHGLDRLAEALSGTRLAPSAATGMVEPLTPAAIVEHVESVAGSTRLRSSYDGGYLTWLFDELERVQARGTLWADGIPRGRLWAELVRAGHVVDGWYICHLRPGGVCRVLQIAATPRGIDTVFAQLSYRARMRGAAALYGRLEPQLVSAVSETRCLIRPGEGRLLVHSRRPEITRAARAGEALLTRLDGEWW